MRRCHEHEPRTIFQQGESRRLLFMLFLLVVLGFAIAHAGNPGTWRWLADDRRAEAPSPVTAAVADRGLPRTAPEAKLGPTDEDSDEADAAREEFQALSDQKPLGPEEMPAYWRLMKWSKNQTFSEMRGRARGGTLYTQLWEQPGKYRGKLVFLRLHLRRALRWDAPANPDGVKEVYEAWGTTNESVSLPYLVVFSELPPGMSFGADIQEEATFVGYFLKTMAYQAFDTERAAPLLVGRLELAGPRGPAARSAGESKWFWLTLLGGGVVLLVVIGAWAFRRRPTRVSNEARRTLLDDGQLDDWLARVQETAGEEGPEPTESDDVA
jgi:hypothetical protein